MNTVSWPKVFAYVGLALIGLVLAYYATAVENAGIAAALLGRANDGLDLVTTGSAAFLVGVAMFAIFAYLALKTGWSNRARP